MSNILFGVCIILPVLCIGSGCYFIRQVQKKCDILSIVLISVGLALIRMTYRDILMSWEVIKIILLW